MANSRSDNWDRSNKRSPEEWAVLFDEFINRERRTVFELGKTLIEAEAELSKKDFATAIKISGLKTRTTALNYMRVAESKLLNDPNLQKKLPSTVGALIDLAAWTRDDIIAASRDGVIHPQAQRAQLKKWKSDRQRKKTLERYDKEHEEATGDPPPIPDAIIVGYVKADGKTWTREKWQDFFKVYNRLRDEEGLIPNDVTLTLFDSEVPSISQHMQSKIRERLIKAFETSYVFLEDPYFKQFWTRDKSGERCVDINLVHRKQKDIATYLSSSDFRDVHKFLRFSKEDWAFLGVTDVGSPTVTAFLKSSSKSSSKTKASPKTKKLP